MTRRNKPHYNLHHTQFYRAHHESMTDLRKIRQDSRLIVPLDLDAHNELHRQVALVPPLSSVMATKALSLFREYGDARDPIDNLQNYMKSIEEAAKHPRAHEMEQSVADLAVWACEMQIPFIQEGFVDLRTNAERNFGKMYDRPREIEEQGGYDL